MRHLLIAVGCVLLPWVAVLADELPKDGWWIRYRSNIKDKANDQVQEYTCKSTYSFVGTVVEDGETCRWVESHSVCTFGDKEFVTLSKWLVPEKELLENEQAMKKAKRGWAKTNEGEVREIKAAQRFARPDFSFLPAHWQKSETVEDQRVVDYQRGRLTMPKARTQKVTNEVSVDRPRLKSVANLKLVIEKTAWFDSKTSPAVLAMKRHVETYEKDALRNSREEDLEVEDFGSDAKSRLPDNN